MTDIRAAVAGTVLPGFEGLTLPNWLRDRLSRGLAGVCLFGENIQSPQQLRELTAAIRAANPAAVIAIDEEGGDVTRLFYRLGSPYPGNAVLGRIDDTAQTEAVAAEVGAALAEAGITLDFAPDVDVNSNPDNPVIGVRSFGASAEHVARHSAAWVRGLQSTGVTASAKHFPGHGDTSADSHRALPVVDLPLEALRSRELLPFAAAIEAGAKTIMTSHILLPQLDPEHPATLSSTILGLLRHELGFTGVIVSDALDMAGASASIGIPEAAVRALAAGCDLLCIGTKNTDAQLRDIEDAVLAAIADGRLPETRVRAAARAVRALATAIAPVPSVTTAMHEKGVPVEVGAAVGVGAVDAVGSVCAEGDRKMPSAAEVAATFDVSDHARSWIDAGPPGLVVRLYTPANEAVGTAPWGPFAVNSWQQGIDVVTLTERSAAALEGAGDSSGAGRRFGGDTPLGDDRALGGDSRFAQNRIVVIGRDNHRSAWVRRLVDTLRCSNEVLVVDMGWPDAGRAYADIATFGASRLVGEALLTVLAPDGNSSAATPRNSATTASATPPPGPSTPPHLDTPPATIGLHHERLTR